MSTPVHIAVEGSPMRPEYMYDSAGIGVHWSVISQILYSWSRLAAIGDTRLALLAALREGSGVTPEGLAWAAIESVVKEHPFMKGSADKLITAILAAWSSMTPQHSAASALRQACGLSPLINLDDIAHAAAKAVLCSDDAY